MTKTINFYHHGGFNDCIPMKDDSSYDDSDDDNSVITKGKISYFVFRYFLNYLRFFCRGD